MGNAVFPTLPGQTWGFVRKPIFKTKVQESVSGSELRASFQQYPTYHFSMPIEFLRDSRALPELQTLKGFFLARGGSFDSFLYTDPDDSTATDMPFGTGDGVATQFQLVRSYGAGSNLFAEPVQNISTLSGIKISGVLTTKHDINNTGLVTFATPPSAGSALTWSGSFYYRCRFLADEANFTKMMRGLWEIKNLEFKGAPGNKV